MKIVLKTIILFVVLFSVVGCNNMFSRKFYKSRVSKKKDNEVIIRYKNKREVVLDFYSSDITSFAYLKQVSKYRLEKRITINYSMSNVIFDRVEHGKWIYYDANGNILKKERYKNGIMIGTC